MVATTQLKPFEPLPDSSVPAKELKSPEVADKPLAPLAKEINPTLSALVIDEVPDGARYAIVMRPYGIGPSSMFGSRLVIYIDSAKPQGDAPQVDKLAKQTWVALMNTAKGGAVTTGGTYRATITFYSNGEKMIPVLSEAERLAD